MNRSLPTTVLSAAVGLALAMQGTPTYAADVSDMMKMMMEKMQKERLEQCYGINAVAKNDCSAGAQNCGGNAKEARDPKSFVLVPAGVCSKIAGGSLNPA